jgi:uncharacterized BrkB/YihY/UPF0761 family membrane protein
MGRMVAQVWSGFNSNAGALLGGGLAFFGALSASPLIVVASAASRQIGGKAVSSAEVFDPIAVVVGPKAAGAVAQTVAHSPATGSGSATLQVLALVFALAAGAGLFVQFRTVLDIMFGFPRPKEFRGWGGDLVYGVAATAVIAAIAVAHAFALRFVGTMAVAARPAATMWVQILTGLVVVALVPVAYRYLARTTIPWSASMVGAAVAVVFAVAATVLASLYFSTGTAAKVYGPAASMFVALTWLLIIGNGVVMGAVSAFVWQYKRAPLQ